VPTDHDASGRDGASVTVFQRAAEGDREALSELFRTYQHTLLRFLRGLAVATAEDVASQVWLEVARSLPRFEGDERAFRRWLFTIARRRMIDAFRIGARRREDLPGELPDGGVVELHDEPDAAIEWAERLLRRLPRMQAEVVFLRSVAGLTVAEVAEVTGRSPGAVRVLGHRGLNRLRELLMDEDLVPLGVTNGALGSMD
jgi:RNA polymerase sigma-70 factor (ECF subfamily)